MAREMHAVGVRYGNNSDNAKLCFANHGEAKSRAIAQITAKPNHEEKREF